MRPALLFAALPFALNACSHTPTPISINVTTEQETDAFTADPAVTEVTVHVTSLDGTIDMTSAPTPPGGTFDLGDVSDDQQVSVEVTGKTADGDVVLEGFSLSGILLSSVNDIIPVFAQRVNQWARPPGGIPQSHLGGSAAVLAERYLMLTGGTTASKDAKSAKPGSVDAYDLLSLGGSRVATLPITPETMLSTGTSVLMIDSTTATWRDFQATDSASGDTDADLDGLSPGDLAGGRIIPGSALSNSQNPGRVFVVGATRSGTPSKAVLAVDLDGTPTSFQLRVARQGAAAVWVENVGLVVAGGSADGAGAELLADGGSGFMPLGFPPDPSQGAGAAAVANGVLLVGGASGGTAAPTRLLSTACAGTCTPSPQDNAELPATFGNVSAFSLADGSVLVIGDQSDTGETRSFRLDFVNPPAELVLRERRKGATVLPAPNGTLALLGGEHVDDGTPAVSVELFLPYFK